MGNVQNTSVQASLTLLQQNITNIAITAVNSAGAICNTNQVLNINFKNIKNCANVVGQTSNVNCNLTTLFSTNTNTNLTSIISTAVAQTAASMQQSVQDFLAASLNVQNTSTSVQTAITNILTTNVAQSFYNSCIAKANVDQTGTLNFTDIDCSQGGNNMVTQNAQLLVLVNCVNNTVVTLLTNAVESTQVAQTATATQASTQKGISQLVSALALPLIILGVVIVVIAIMYFVVKSRKSQAAPAKPIGLSTGATMPGSAARGLTATGIAVR